MIAGTAMGDGISNPTVPGVYGIGGGINQFDGGISGGGGGGPPANPCTGAANFSDGCAVAVFGH